MLNRKDELNEELYYKALEYEQFVNTKFVDYVTSECHNREILDFYHRECLPEVVFNEDDNKKEELPFEDYKYITLLASYRYNVLQPLARRISNEIYMLMVQHDYQPVLRKDSIVYVL